MMPGKFIILNLAIAFVVTAAPSVADDAAPTNSAPARTTLESFRIISERNIFNQNRSPRSARRETTERRPEPVIQALSLVGTMIYPSGTFAFFDGTSSDYRKPVKPGEKIAGYEVREITPSGVKIANESGEFDMKVGQQLRREDQAEWQLSTSNTRLSTRAASAESGSATAADSAASEGGSSEDEALKRLMQKRAKELNE